MPKPQPTARVKLSPDARHWYFELCDAAGYTIHVGPTRDTKAAAMADRDRLCQVAAMARYVTES